MYSQYQQYQHQGGATVATQQQGLTWNGSSWVGASSQQQHVGSGTHSTYSSNQNNPAQVKLYTEYYNGWKATEEQEQRTAQTLTGEAQQEATRKVAWAKYYADQASRAAHWFHSPEGPQPALPPAPTATATTAATSPAQVAPVSSTSQPSQQTPGSLKRYVHSCLSQCKGKEDLTKMQAQVQAVIGEAVKDGTMHTIDWDNKPPLSLYSTITSTNSPSTAAAMGSFANSSSVNQPVAWGNHQQASTSAPSAGNNVSYRGNQSSSYYGPGPSSSTLKNDSYYGTQASTQQKESSYYGGAGTSERAGRSGSYYGPGTSAWNVSNTSYYGNSESKSTMNDEFIEVPKMMSKKAKKAQKESKHKKRPNNDGMDRSSTRMSKRANRFAGAGGIESVSNSQKTVSSGMDKYMGKQLIGGSNKQLDENDFEKMVVKGTCQTLEKDYFRLTAPPRAELVRPQTVMEKHLQNLKDQRLLPKRKDYNWFCSQFKALRQDLTVQRVFNTFAVDVYETHARIALEEQDLNEYNQCQTQLKELYRNLRDTEPKALTNQDEFIAFRIIYYVFLTGNKKYDGGSADMNEIMMSLTAEQRQHTLIAHALKVRSAVADFNYHTFFRSLYKNCPSTAMSHLLSFMVPNVRQWALQRICRAYRPSAPIDFVLSELGFEDNEREYGCKWLESCGCVLDGDTLLAKDSTVHESNLKAQNSLI